MLSLAEIFVVDPRDGAVGVASPVEPGRDEGGDALEAEDVDDGRADSEGARRAHCYEFDGPDVFIGVPEASTAWLDP